MDWRARIDSKPDVMHGRLCIKGTRVPVSVVLDNLAAGLAAEDIVASYPSLGLEDVRAALAYAAEIARDRVIEFQDVRREFPLGEVEPPVKMQA